jgi:hypothetical protein
MKLFLVWLLGVPLLVASMVSVPAVGHLVMPATSSNSQCLLENQDYGVALAVTDQGNRVPCHSRPVK